AIGAAPFLHELAVAATHVDHDSQGILRLLPSEGGLFFFPLLDLRAGDLRESQEERQRQDHEHCQSPKHRKPHFPARESSLTETSETVMTSPRYSTVPRNAARLFPPPEVRGPSL